MTVNVNRFSNKEEFLAWIKTLGDRRFSYINPSECVLATWAKECGARNPSSGSRSIGFNLDSSKGRFSFPEWMMEVALFMAAQTPLTADKVYKQFGPPPPSFIDKITNLFTGDKNAIQQNAV